MSAAYQPQLDCEAGVEKGSPSSIENILDCVFGNSIGLWDTWGGVVTWPSALACCAYELWGVVRVVQLYSRGWACKVVHRFNHIFIFFGWYRAGVCPLGSAILENEHDFAAFES